MNQNKGNESRTNIKHLALRHFPAIAGYILVVAALNYPLILNFNTAVIGRSFDDVFEVLWQLSWMDTAVFDLQTFPFYTQNIFYPHGWYTASGAQPSWYFLAFAPLTHLLGTTITYNLVSLGTFVVGSFGVYLLVYHLTRQRFPGFVAGCVYLSAPVLTLRLGGHIHILLGAQVLPYAVLFTFLALTTAHKIRWRWVVLAAISFALTILGTWYFLFIATLPLLALVLFASGQNSWKMRVAIVGMIGILTLAIISPFAFLTWQARQEMFTEEAIFSLADADRIGASLDRMLVPNPLHGYWGEYSINRFPLRGEQDAVSIGFAATILAAFGLMTAPWKKTRPFVFLGLIALLLALGTTLYWNGQRVMISDLPYAEQIANFLYADLNLPEGQLAIPLPGLLFYYWLPLYSAIRVYARFTIQLMLAVAVLAGFGVNYLSGKGKAGRYLTYLACFLILFEGLTFPNRVVTPVAVNHRQVDRWLASLPDEVNLIEYPRNRIDISALYSQSIHKKNVVNGYMSIQPSYLEELSGQLGKYPHQESIPILRDWQIDYVLVSAQGIDEEFYDSELPKLMELQGLCFQRSFADGSLFYDEVYVFTVLPPDELCRNLSP